MEENMTDDFVVLTPYVKNYVPGKCEPEWNRSMKKRFAHFLKSLDSELSIVVLCDQSCGCKKNIAYTVEHYDLGTTNPARIFVRQTIAEEIEKKFGGLDFPGLCRLFLREGRFAVFETFQGAPVQKQNPYATREEGWYQTPVEEYGVLIHEIEKAHGELVPFYQNLIAENFSYLFCEKQAGNQQAVKQILEQIDDDILCGCGCIPYDVLTRILSFKYGKDAEQEFVYRSGKLKFNNLFAVPLKEIPFTVRSMEPVQGGIRIKGNVMLPLSNSDIEYFLMDNRNKRCEIPFTGEDEAWFMGEELHTRKQFELVLKPGNKSAGYRFMYRYRDMYQARIRMEFAEELDMADGTRHNFRAVGNYLIKIEKRILFIAPLMRKTRIKLFFTFLWKSIKI